MKKTSIYCRYIIFAACILVLTCTLSFAQKNILTHFPERVILNPTQTPHNSQAVTWRTRNCTTPAKAQIIPVSDLMNSKAVLKTVFALTTPIKSDHNLIAYHHSVVFDFLLPGILYAYRVGHDQLWSEWNQFKTATQTHDPFTFMYFGDIQKQIFPMCAQVMRSAFQQEPDARFWLFAGDMVNNGPDDTQWDAFFSAMGWIPRTLSIVPVPGNHEYPDCRFIPPEECRMTPIWRQQFTLPENSLKGLEETVYSFTYQGALFIVLNGNEQIQQQAQWLETCLSKNKSTWIIVAVHQPMYSVSKKRDPKQFKQIFVPIFDRFSVDLVLQGHDHGYARTLPLKNNRPVIGNEKGTIYVISNAGPKFYTQSNRYDNLMEKTGAGKLLFQSIRVDKAILQFTAYDLSKKIFDTFDIRK